MQSLVDLQLVGDGLVEEVPKLNHLHQREPWIVVFIPADEIGKLEDESLPILVKADLEVGAD